LDLTDEETAAIRDVPVHIATVKADEIISREGDRPSRSFIVVDGLTCTSKASAGGKRQITTLQIPGDAPDLHSLQLQLLDCDIWAITDCTLALMPHQDLRALSRRHPRLMEELWRITLVEGAIYREWIVNVAQRQADSRMAHLFCEIMLRMRTAGLAREESCPLAVTQADLSEMTGMTPVHVNRTLQDLRARDLISFGNGTLTIHDQAGLTELGDFRSDYLHLRSTEVA
jgi:CRP-like cAMP-binding protein